MEHKFASDTERVIYDVLAKHAEETRGQRRDPRQPIWVSLYGRPALSDLVYYEWRSRFPDRRNRPSHRNMLRAIQRLVDDRLILQRVDDNYRDAIWFCLNERVSA